MIQWVYQLLVGFVGGGLVAFGLWAVIRPAAFFRRAPRSAPHQPGWNKDARLDFRVEERRPLPLPAENYRER